MFMSSLYGLAQSAPSIKLYETELHPYLRDLHAVFIDRPHWAGVVLILCSMLCGTIVGLERESKDKPAGVRTLALICVGSTIFTLASLLAGEGVTADRSRIAAQIVSGIGFLGAGVIIRERGTVTGLTTGATIWTVSAIGVLIGLGYAVAGLVLTLLVLLMLTTIRRFEDAFQGQVALRTIHLCYKPEGGKTRVRLHHILDEYHLPQESREIQQQDTLETMNITYQHHPRKHRLLLTDLIGVGAITQVDTNQNRADGARHAADS